jgi:predicted HicB family RNase H-like nuclease
MAADDPIDQHAGDGKSRGGKPRKRTSPVVRRDGKRSLNLRVDFEAHERLAVHALRRGTTISALVEGFAREHLREFHITRTATRAEKPE